MQLVPIKFERTSTQSKYSDCPMAVEKDLRNPHVLPKFNAPDLHTAWTSEILPAANRCNLNIHRACPQLYDAMQKRNQEPPPSTPCPKLNFSAYLDVRRERYIKHQDKAPSIPQNPQLTHRTHTFRKTQQQRSKAAQACPPLREKFQRIRQYLKR